MIPWLSHPVLCTSWAVHAELFLQICLKITSRNSHPFSYFNGLICAFHSLNHYVFLYQLITWTPFFHAEWHTFLWCFLVSQMPPEIGYLALTPGIWHSMKSLNFSLMINIHSTTNKVCLGVCYFFRNEDSIWKKQFPHNHLF